MHRWRLIALAALLLGLSGAALLAFGTTRIAEDGPMRIQTGRVEATDRARASRARPARVATPVPEARVAKAVRTLIARMSPAERVAQLFLVGFEGSTTSAGFFAELGSRGWGGVLLRAENAPTPDLVPLLAGQAAAAARDAGRVAPLVAPVGLPGFEPPAQAARPRPSAVRAAARAAAERQRAAGLTLILAPDADVGTHGIDDEQGTFGDDAKRVARRVQAAVEGWRAGGVVSAVGTFPGEGTVTADPLEGPANVALDAETLMTRDLLPFAAVARRAPAIVVSSAAFLAYDSVTPASIVPGVVQGVLREDLGFKGVAITDDLAGITAATSGSVGQAAVAALKAGIDLVQVPAAGDRDKAYRAVRAALKSGDLPKARAREALERVLEMKRAAGLLQAADAG